MSLIRRDVLEGVQRILIAVLVLVVLAIVYLGVRVAWVLGDPDVVLSATTPSVSPMVPLQTRQPGTPMPTAIPLMTALPTGTRTAGVQSPRPLKVGIVVGHWQNDVGATCPDGLQEVDINLDIAQRVVSQLSLSGYSAEMLAEFSPELNGYEAAVLLSIHTDACNIPEASGFKVARVSSSLVPDIEDQLVSCLIARYQEATGLKFHRNSITFDMTEYHAFYEIAPETPGAIIEIGFMRADRFLLTKRQDWVATGIVNGLKCFIEGVYRRGG
jgi:N-acetylmuramoyl-L-alanine amidase